jgi:hypothetical protein
MQERNNAGIQFDKANHMSLSSILPRRQDTVWDLATKDFASAIGLQGNSTNGCFGDITFILQGSIGEDQDGLFNVIGKESPWPARAQPAPKSLKRLELGFFKQNFCRRSVPKLPQIRKGKAPSSAPNMRVSVLKLSKN